ncbi:hypothetical protein WV31_10845 [Magnetospirillum sp. ME-1]|uniref:hypothetical protein n=1 Tax=Magnetospirillum sp. ME-1 TaxID=1639348 RepID=UPI000A17EDDB|nr:hypothetical protein [Magnetospirillum sp. ME-1]ARJ66125.1 hypothetical protein WV31_10845 [Magnetospirillum sp. ME-1]
MAIQTHREFCPADRYLYDFGLCSSGNGFAQMDTKQDASYYGNWCNPTRRVLFSYVEGDCTTQVADTDEEFARLVRESAEWHDTHGYGPLRLDPGFNAELKAALIRVGLEDLLH